MPLTIVTRGEEALGNAELSKPKADGRTALGWRTIVDGLVLVAAGASAAAMAVSAHGVVRTVAVLVAFCLLPGAAILSRVRLADDLLDWAGFSVALSLSVMTGAALVMVWTGWWHPVALAVVIFAASCCLLLFDIFASLGDSKMRPAKPRLREVERRSSSRGVRGRWESRGATRRRSDASDSESFAEIAERGLQGRLTRDDRIYLGSLRDEPRSSGMGAWILSLSPLVTGMALWALALPHVDTTNLGDYGLPPALPMTWYAGLAVVVAGVVVALSARKPRGVIIGLYVGAVVLILFGTVPAITQVPQYAWVYKHFGVTLSIALQGHVNTSGDIYNRWPGFFALAAVFSRLVGSTDPARYAGWAEVFFTALDALLISVAVRTLVRDVRVAGGAALLFVIGNWVEQNYFSPQALGFALSLACLVLLLKMVSRRRSPLGRRSTLDQPPSRRSLSASSRQAEPRAVARRTLALIALVTRSPVPDAEATEVSGGNNPALLIALLSMYAIIVASHQLTPYVLILQVAALTVVGMMRPRWLVVVMAALAVAYLAPNLAWVNHNYHVFTSLDPFNNAQHSTLYATAPMAGKRFNSVVSQALSFFAWGCAAIAFVRLARQGLARRTLPLLLLAFAPFGIIFGASYGGEASFRIILFSLPFCAALIAWAISTVESTVARTALNAAVITVCVGLFVPAFLGQAELNIMPAGEVRASEYLYAHASKPSVLMLSAPDFPGRLSANYHYFIYPENEDDPNLLRTRVFRNRSLGAGDIPKVIALMKQYSPRGYLVFSTTESRFAHVYRLAPPGALASLERAVAQSPAFRLWYSSKDTRIYELVSNQP